MGTTHGATHWAAVSTHCGWMREPPHSCCHRPWFILKNLRLTCHGCFLAETSHPPMMPTSSCPEPGSEETRRRAIRAQSSGTGEAFHKGWSPQSPRAGPGSPKSTGWSQDSPGVMGMEPPRQGRVRNSSHSICTGPLEGESLDPSTSSQDLGPEARAYVQMGANCSFSAVSLVYPSLSPLQGLIYPLNTGSGHRAASSTPGPMLWPNRSPPFSGAVGNLWSVS